MEETSAQGKTQQKTFNEFYLNKRMKNSDAQIKTFLTTIIPYIILSFLLTYSKLLRFFKNTNKYINYNLVMGKKKKCKKN